MSNSEVPNPAPVLKLFKLSEVETPHRNEIESAITVLCPAQGKGSARALEKLEAATLANGLHTKRPERVATALDTDQNRIYFMPILRLDSPDGLPVSYRKTGFQVNLYNFFGPLDKWVPAGEKHVYRCEMTDSPIRIGEFEGIALYIALDGAVRESIRKLSDARKAELKAKQATKKTARSENTAKVTPASQTEPESAQNDAKSADDPEP